MGLKSIPEDSCSLADIAPDSFQKKPLFVWLRSFAGRELDEDDSFANFVSSNALTYALEYIGIASESEQSSLHLSAIFDEDSHQSRSNKYPSHFESETKSRIQQLNRVFVELISYYDYHHGQIVAIKPPNTVHISSSCHLCGVREFEKFLFLIMGAAIQGTQKQETIKKIKRFPQEIQESLINCIKLLADSPELINIKSWQEFHGMEKEEQKKIYENLLAVIRRFLIERNESIQNQLLSDYYAGFMNCSQRRIYENNKGYGSFSDAEKYSDDTRMSAAIRQLREELQVKSELLQECREELEITKYQVRELESELTETQIKLRAYKKARDELDVLREGQEKNSRLESELHRLKTKLEEAEHVYERVEVLEVENRKLQLQHDMLVDQISFLSLDRPSFDCTGSSSIDIGIVPSLDLDSTLTRDEDKFFDTEDEEPSVKEKIVNAEENAEKICELVKNENQSESQQVAVDEVEKVEESQNALSNENVDEKEEEKKEDIVEAPEPEPDTVENESDFNAKLNENIDEEGDNGPLTSTPVAESKLAPEQKSQEVQTPTSSSKRKKRSGTVNVKRTKKPIFIPVLPGQRLVPVVQEEVITENFKGLEEVTGSPAIKVFKIYNVSRHTARRRSSGKPKKFKSPTGRPLNEKQVVPNLDIGNEADEELSISPNGPRNESDLDSNNDVSGQTEKCTVDNEVYFAPDPGVTHPEVCIPETVSTTPPIPAILTSPNSHFGTTTAFPVANGVRNTQTVHHVTFSHDIPPNTPRVGDEEEEHHSNHLTIYNHLNNNNNNHSNNNNIVIKDSQPTTVQLPLLRISNGVNVSLQHTDTEDEEDEVQKRLRSAFNIHLQHQQQQQQQEQPQHVPVFVPPVQQQQQTPQPRTSPGGGASIPNPTAPFNNNDNEFKFSDYNIQVNLRNSMVTPATAFINKISTLASSNSSGGGSSTGTGILRGGANSTTSANNTNQTQYYHAYPPHESSSEDDESVWYEYGCV